MTTPLTPTPTPTPTPTTTPIDPTTWEAARHVVRRARRSGLHVAVSSVNPDGSPHVTPIGSLRLLDQPGAALWLDVLNARLRRNVDRDARITILALDSRRRVWLPALIKGRFERSPGVQLVATVGPRRDLSEAERQSFQRAIGVLGSTRGGRALWGKLEVARDLEITEVRALKLGSMTATT